MSASCVWNQLAQCLFFFFQAEDGIRDAQESRGLGDVYKRQGNLLARFQLASVIAGLLARLEDRFLQLLGQGLELSLIHI